MILEISNISKSYGKVCALENFSVTLTPGIYALLGPNGAGKSTLMNILTDNLKSDGGEISFTDSEDISELKTISELGQDFRAKIGYMPQYPGNLPEFTVDLFLQYIATLKGVGEGKKKEERKRFIDSQIADILHEVDLVDVRYRKIKTLSGGMKQRLGLAQAVLGDPSILILDEPTAGLDPKQRIAIRNYISKISFNKIVLIATHVVSDVEYIAKEIILLKKGIIVDKATPQELLAKIEGKVWSVSCTSSCVADYQRSFYITNIQKNEKNINIRILSESQPTNDAILVAPTLEDYYVYTVESI